METQTETEYLGQLASTPPSQWLHNATTLVIIIGLLGRGIHALRSGGGLVGIYRSLVFGVSTPSSVAQPTSSESVSGSNSVKEQVNKTLTVLLLGCVLALGSVGCSTALKSDKIVKHTTRFFGIDVATTATSTGTPQVRLGWGSDTFELIPTSTNGVVYAPRNMTAFNLKQGLNPFATDIEENSGWGDVYIGGTNDTSKAIVPSEYWHPPILKPQPEPEPTVLK